MHDLFFTGCVFDTPPEGVSNFGTSGSYLVINIFFTNCWMTSRWDGTGANTLHLDNVRGVTFSGGVISQHLAYYDVYGEDASSVVCNGVYFEQNLHGGNGIMYSGCTYYGKTASCISSAQRNTDLSVPANTPTTFVANDEAKDTWGAYNTSSGQFTCPLDGDYRVTAMYRTESTSWDAGDEISLGVTRNGYEVTKVISNIISGKYTGICQQTGTAYVANCEAGDVLATGFWSTKSCVIDGGSWSYYNHLTFEYVPTA